MSKIQTGDIYTTGSLYNGGTKYWLVTKITHHFVTFTRLQWSDDLENELGVMRPTREAVRLKIGRHYYKSGIGYFDKRDQRDEENNPIIVKTTTPTHPSP